MMLVILYVGVCACAGCGGPDEGVRVFVGGAQNHGCQVSMCVRAFGCFDA